MRWSSFVSEGAAGRVTSGWVPLRPAQKERRVQDVWCPVPWGPCLRRRPRKQGSLEGDMALWCSCAGPTTQSCPIWSSFSPCQPVTVWALPKGEPDLYRWAIPGRASKQKLPSHCSPSSWANKYPSLKGDLGAPHCVPYKRRGRELSEAKSWIRQKRERDEVAKSNTRRGMLLQPERKGRSWKQHMGT